MFLGKSWRKQLASKEVRGFFFFGGFVLEVIHECMYVWRFGKEILSHW